MTPAPDRLRDAPWHRHRRPLLWKLFLIYLVTTILVTAAVTGGFHLFFDPGGKNFHFAVRHLRWHAQSLATYIGTPPDFARAQTLAHDLGIGIRIETPGSPPWLSAPGIPPISRIARHSLVPGGTPMGWHHDRGFAVHTAGQTQYLFTATNRAPLWAPLRHLGWLLAILLFLLLLSYLTVHRIMRPLRGLRQGVQAVAAGDFSHRIETHGNDELADLAEAFNTMSARVKSMLGAERQLLLDISHELRSPLTRMKLALSLAPPFDTKESLETDIGELEALISELLESQRLQSANGAPQLEPTDARELVQSALARLGPARERIAYTPPPEAILIPADLERAVRALANVFANALKYGADAPTPVQCTLAREPGIAVITVRDHGPGIPPDLRERVFEPFFRADPSRTRATGGYGLGLSLVRAILRAHGGDARIADLQPGAPGAAVRLEFPLLSHGSLSRISG